MKTLTAYAFCLALATSAWGEDIVLAKNEWTTVTKADFDTEIARIPKEQQFGFLASAQRVAQMVEGILVNKTLAAQARAARLDQDPAVRAEVASATDKVLARHQTERAEAQLKVPDLEKRAEELYKSNPGKYAEKDIVHTKHILIDAKCRSVDAAKSRALEARAEVESGKPFEDVARKYSDEPGVAKSGGDIGPLLADNLTPAFAEAVQKLKPGELSQPVLTNFGVHIIKLESFKKGRQIAYSEVRLGIMGELKEDWLKQQRKAFVEKITADPKLKLELDNIQALKTNINAPAPQPSTKRPG